MDLLAARHLLDPDWVLERVRGLVPAARDLATPPRIDSMWVKPERHFNVAYVWPGPNALRLTGFALDDDAMARARKALAKRCRHPTDTCAACDSVADEHHVLWQPFPHDYRLPALAECVRPESVRHLLPHDDIITAEALAYRPGMRALLRYGTASGATVFGKVAHERQPRQYLEPLLRAGEAARRQGSSLRLPRVLAYEPRLGIGLIEALDGESLHARLLRNETTATCLSRSAEALRRLHLLHIESEARRHAPEDELALLRVWIDLVEALGKTGTDPRRQAWYQLEAAVPDPAAALVAVHRDFYDKQVLLAPEQTALLDLDTLAHGDAEIDLGNFIAHLFLRGVQWKRDEEMQLAAATFLAAYPASIDVARLHWYRRSTLLRLSCVYALRPNCEAIVRALLAEVHAA